MFAEAATASAGGSGAGDGASSVVNQRAEVGPVWFRDAEQLADHGERQREGEALDQVDGGVAAAVEVVQQVVGDRLDPGRSAATRGLLKAGEASRRSRVWSGGSTLSMCRASAGPGRPSATTCPVAGERGVHVLGQRGWFSAALASSWPTTSHARCPSASVTSCTGPAARTCANSGNGSSRS